MAVMERLAVIGNGMAGVACVAEIARRSARFAITIYGDERHCNYNRILLSSVLSGEAGEASLTLNDEAWYERHGIGLRLGTRIVAINPERRTLTRADGGEESYDRLLIATGSSAAIPPLHGLSLPTRAPGRPGEYLRGARAQPGLRPGVFVFRTLEDVRAMRGAARPGVRAAVIGGGLLGLEAARGLQRCGCEVTVVHLPETLMERQLDASGGRLLAAQMEALGVTVLVGRRARAIVGEAKVEGLSFADGASIAAEMVVIAAGIRPNAELARQAGLAVQRGIIVNDQLETSHPGVYAVGECAEHAGICYGIVAPLYEQGRALAAHLAGDGSARFTPPATGTRLKVAGVEVCSAGEWDEGARPSLEAIRYEDTRRGVYKKLVLDGNRLAGFILVGDASREPQYLECVRSAADLGGERQGWFGPPTAASAGTRLAELPDTATVCGCKGVTKGDVIRAVHERGATSLAALPECTGAATSCGACASLCRELLQSAAPDDASRAKPGLCACLPYEEAELREMIRGQRLRSVREVLEIYGTGPGCEICQPALAYLLDVIWCGEHDEDRSARFINDRVHANIQKDGTFSVIPRMRGGVTSPAELRRIADAAEQYQVRMVKVTGSQRIDLLGVRKQDLPGVWAALGMPSGQAYTKGVRMVKTCVGSEFCRFGVQDSTAAGIELERRLENLFTPHKVKMAAVGCPRNCAEATVKDIGLIGQEGSWQVVVGGAAGKRVRQADLLVTVESTEQALEAAMLFFQYYRERARYQERSYDFVERVGMAQVRKETVYASSEQKAGLLERLRRSKERSSDAWREGGSPRTASQFVPLEALVGGRS